MRCITIALWLLILITPCASQNEKRQEGEQSKPNLTGTWVYDQGRSYPASTRRRITSILSIVHRDPEIRMTVRLTLEGQASVNSEVVLYSDGRGERNYGYSGQAGYSRTKWEAGTLVTRLKKSTYTSMGWTKHYEERTDRWKLSKDGRTLTRRTVTMVWPNNSDPGSSKEVYTRAP